MHRSRGKWSGLPQKPGADNKRFKKVFYSDQYFYTHKIFCFRIFFIFQGQINKAKILKLFILWSNLRQTIKIQKIFCILGYFFIYPTNLYFSSSRRFLYQSQPYWRFFSFSSSERFLFPSRAYWCFLFFSSSGRFWYLLGPFFERLLCVFDNILLIFIYRKKVDKKIFPSFFICFKN